MSLFILTIGSYDDREDVFYSTTASHHIFNDLKWFSSFDRIQGQRTFKTATRTDLRTLARGTVKMTVGPDTWTLSDAYYVPGAPANFLSAWKLNIKGGVIFESSHDRLVYKKSGDVVCRLVRGAKSCGRVPEAQPFGHEFYF
ncbi:Retrovirus-related Pol polyprotein from transposon TNT 1-94 [Ophiocordyceps camponoti-floridani]|uniref:Retrovirus-related Pol polyprotein from transposon TNT 1-94 n=1 Tax=Ophiocordyceps camponoti-floridani TaxID=2030778 RepID=A0A8H4QDI3_9HYPO|nr:Retrovirus-related Pol polyprotein from transposon TNT 1-94 [Ophiocordyceps camponoti-floridani]